MQHNLAVDSSHEDIQWVEGHLKLDWTRGLGYPCIFYIADWGRGLKWWSEISGEIEIPSLLQDPGIDLLSSSESPAVIQWQQTIPADIRERVAFYPEHPIVSLYILRHWPEANDLLESNPLLLWLALDYAIINNWNIADLRTSLGLTQHELLQRIGLSGTRSSCRILRKIKIEQLGLAEKQAIRQIWKQPDSLRRMSHYSTITYQALTLIKQYPWIAGQPLASVFEEMDCNWQHAELMRTIQDIFRMSQDEERLQRQISNCISTNAVNNIHDRLVEETNNYNPNPYNILLDNRGSPVPFPAPPHPGTDLIQPIANQDALAEEGRKMQHCVYSYIRDIQTGRYYVYHMDSPQRLTIGVRVRDGKIVNHDQIKGILNCRAHVEALEIVMDWFQDALHS